MGENRTVLGSNMAQAIVLAFGDGKHWVRKGIVGILQIRLDQISTVTLATVRQCGLTKLALGRMDS